MKKIQISPSILSADFSQLANEIKRLESSGADMIHVDVMDGHFVPNLTIGPPVIKNLRKHTKVPFDVHLMISPVHKYIKDYAEAGADIITIHPEATENLVESINHIKSLNIPTICFPRNIKNYKEFCEVVKPDAINIDYNINPSKIIDELNLPIQGGLDPKILLSDKENLKKIF